MNSLSVAKCMVAGFIVQTSYSTVVSAYIGYKAQWLVLKSDISTVFSYAKNMWYICISGCCILSAPITMQDDITAYCK